MHTRDNKLKIYQDHVHYNLRKYFFANRVICIWNSLPDSIIEANSVDAFNNRIGSKTLFEKHYHLMIRTSLLGLCTNIVINLSLHHSIIIN